MQITSWVHNTFTVWKSHQNKVFKRVSSSLLAFSLTHIVHIYPLSRWSISFGRSERDESVLSWLWGAQDWTFMLTKAHAHANLHLLHLSTFSLFSINNQHEKFEKHKKKTLLNIKTHWMRWSRLCLSHSQQKGMATWQFEQFWLLSILVVYKQKNKSADIFGG